MQRVFVFYHILTIVSPQVVLLEGICRQNKHLTCDCRWSCAPIGLSTQCPYLSKNLCHNGICIRITRRVVTQASAEEGAELVVVCNKLEAEIAELEDDEKMEFLTDLGMEEPGLDRVIPK